MAFGLTEPDKGSETINAELSEFIKNSGKPFLGYHGEADYIQA